MRSDWESTTLGDVAKVLVGPAFKSEVYRSCSEGVPVVRGMNLGPEGLRWEETFHWPEHDLAGYEKYLLEAGQTLVAMDATFTSGGAIRAGIVEEDDLPLLLNQRVAAISAGSTVVDGFVAVVIRSDGLRNFLSNRQTGAFAPHISKQDLTGFPLALPPLAEQRRIVDLVESVDAYIDALRVQADAARTARTSLLHKLLNAGGEDWAHSTLGEACEMYQPKTITKKDLSDDGNFPVYGANGLIGRYDQYNHEESEIAVTCRGATCGTVNRIPERSWITGNAMVIRPLREDLSKEYLFLALSGATNLKATISGSAQPQITRASLKPVALPIPPPHEQNRIVDLVASVEELTATSETTLVSAIQLRAALLEELLSGNHEIPESYDALLEAS